MKIGEGEMYLKLKQLKLRRVLLIVLVLTIAITAVTASAKFWGRENLNPGPPPHTPVTQSPKQVGPNPNMTLLPIRLIERGFTRAELTAPAGNFELLIINVSGEPGLTFQFEREHENGNKPEEFNSLKGKPLRKKIHLKPGVYRLSVVEHPEWVCRLNITES
jgi:hypothetical protein